MERHADGTYLRLNLSQYPWQWIARTGKERRKQGSIAHRWMDGKGQGMGGMGQDRTGVEREQIQDRCRTRTDTAQASYISRHDIRHWHRSTSAHMSPPLLPLVKSPDRQDLQQWSIKEGAGTILPIWETSTKLRDQSRTSEGP